MSKHASVKWKFTLAIVAAIVIFCTQYNIAFALELRVRNNFDKKLFIAVIYYDAEPKEWRTRGWYSTEPSSERKINFDAANSSIYIYAEISGSPIT